MRARFVVVGAVVGAVVMVTAGCGGGGPGAEFSNYTGERVTVSIEGTDKVLVVEPSSDATLGESGCIGTGIVVTRGDGSVAAAFDGATCPETAVAIRGDWSVLVSGDLATRAP
ncbi:hypothetical protein Cch01nite_23760 [Cellulomonas chitinilytica]|uniref:Uncharacterized protein n=1 Tax=Cellulomonas chitinilytica TaxID=398759 RepID=A0A919U2N5_9CELL|nr:hypothetical protein [Cellulomonas chitinilytica]GIG21652.1 hypothetical protein Cch01nite_23760 [Cellulomonas chitinilytica]